jgi:CheY-like chemotaxis protein
MTEEKMPPLATELLTIAEQLAGLSEKGPDAVNKRIAQISDAVRSVAEKLPSDEGSPPEPIGAVHPTRKILLVEDDPVAQETLKVSLSAYGDVEVFETGEDVIRHLGTHVANDPPDVVVLDIQLPGMDGHEVLKKIRALQAIHRDRFHPHVLMTSALDSKEHVVTSLRMGAAGYLVKPVRAEGLARQMSAIGLEPLSSSA